MHEMSIAESLIDIIKEEMNKHNVQALKSVKLEIGQLSAVVPASLAFCFDIITKGTHLEGTELLMDMVPLKAICRACHEAFEITEFIFICPHCAGKDIQTIEGQNLSIVEINTI